MGSPFGSVPTPSRISLPYKRARASVPRPREARPDLGSKVALGLSMVFRREGRGVLSAPGRGNTRNRPLWPVSCILRKRF